MADKAPSFQFYPSDWLSDARVRALSRTHRGTYIDLLCHMWLEGYGRIKLTKKIYRTLGLSKAQWEDFFANICTPGDEILHIDGEYLVSHRMQQERAKQEVTSAARSKAIKSRWIQTNNKCNTSGDDGVSGLYIQNDTFPLPLPLHKEIDNTADNTESGEVGFGERGNSIYAAAFPNDMAPGARWRDLWREIGNRGDEYFAATVTVASLKAAKELAKKRGMAWGPGCFRCWQQEFGSARSQSQNSDGEGTAALQRIQLENEQRRLAMVAWGRLPEGERDETLREIRRAHPKTTTMDAVLLWWRESQVTA